MSAREITTLLSQRLQRRRFLTRVVRTAMAVAAGVAAFPTTVANAACCTQCSDYETRRLISCCELGYFATCSDLSCFNEQNQWWVWPCCDVNNKRWYCYECCPWRCSKAVYQGFTCPSAPARAA